VTGEEAAQSNKYNQNFRNRFCGCGEDYDPNQEKGTMFQCLGLGTVEDGGCGEDWWHPECLVGYTREEYAKMIEKPKVEQTSTSADMTDVSAAKMEEAIPAINADMADASPEQPRNGIPAVNDEINAPPDIAQATITGRIDAAIANGTGIDGNDVAAEADEEDDDPPLPPGFPAEEAFDHFICYKCLKANSWITKYAGSTGFLPPVYLDKALNNTQTADVTMGPPQPTTGETKKRKASDEDEEESTSSNLAAPVPAKRQKSEDPSGPLSSIPEDTITLPITPNPGPNNTFLALPQARLPRPPLSLPILLSPPKSASPTPRRRRHLRASHVRFRRGRPIRRHRLDSRPRGSSLQRHGPRPSTSRRHGVCASQRQDFGVFEAVCGVRRSSWRGGCKDVF
jgi:E3 ubiquitin-protein ligase UBR7